MALIPLILVVVLVLFLVVNFFVTKKRKSSQHGQKLNYMEKPRRKRIPIKQVCGITGKQEKNAGSGAFNRGSADDPYLNEGVADATPNPEKVSKEKENPKSGNIGKNNAGGYEHLKK